MRSCLRASSGLSDRTCSMNRRRPPGRSTRRSSRRARGWSSTPQSTRVETAVSNVPSSKGRSSAGARRTVAPRACRGPCARGGATSGPLAPSSSATRRPAVEGQVAPCPCADLENPAARLGEHRLSVGSQPGLFDLGHLAVVRRGEEPAPKCHGCLGSSGGPELNVTTRSARSHGAVASSSRISGGGGPWSGSSPCRTANRLADARLVAPILA